MVKSVQQKKTKIQPKGFATYGGFDFDRENKRINLSESTCYDILMGSQRYVTHHYDRLVSEGEIPKSLEEVFHIYIRSAYDERSIKNMSIACSAKYVVAIGELELNDEVVNRSIQLLYKKTINELINHLNGLIERNQFSPKFSHIPTEYIEILKVQEELVISLLHDCVNEMEVKSERIKTVHCHQSNLIH